MTGIIRKASLAGCLALALASVSGCVVIDTEVAAGTPDAQGGQNAQVRIASPATPAQPVPPSSPGCILVVQGTVTDRANFFGRYVTALPPLYTRYGGSYLAVGRPQETLEGSLGFQSVVMSRWPSCDAARAFWNSPEYQALARDRQPWGRFDVYLIEASR
jgi:uncharacterized protein (DUF1330 family)